MKIAVLLDENKNTSSFDKDGSITVYDHINNEWIPLSTIDYIIHDINNSQQLMDILQRVGENLKGCKILVVNRIRGIHYIAMERNGISLLEIPGTPEKFLDLLIDCENHYRLDKSIPLEHTAIYQTRPGYFHIDLRDIILGKTSYNSRQILMPFFKTTQFEDLEIITTHVPKWFDKELIKYDLAYKIRQYKQNCKINIYPMEENKTY